MTNTWTVAIVGCGPIGAFLANLCGKYGLRTIVIERDAEPYALPRAVHVDHEMIRLFADIGLRDTIVPLMRAGDGHLHIGADGGMIRYLSLGENAPRPFGYANDYFFYQPELETCLRKGLERYPHVSLKLGTEVVELSMDGERAQLTLSDGSSVDADWVVGCDGARSAIRKLLGIELEDFDFDEPWLVVDAEVDGPISFPDYQRVPAGANLQNLSVMLCDPGRPSTIVPGRGNHRRWEFMLLPGEQDSAMAQPGIVESLVSPWIQGSQSRIVRAATYRFHGLVARQWRIDRAFLAGDSAHQTPPFFGQGMCHGLRDAANLAWKLSMVSDGKASKALLDTYQQERSPQVSHVISAAIEAGKYICELDPAKAAERDARMRSQKDIRAAGELIAPIASGVIQPGAGERFINPRISEISLMDDVTGGGWTLLTRTPIQLSDQAQRVLDALGARTFTLRDDLADIDGHLGDWFDKAGAEAALVRPDFYLALKSDKAERVSADIIWLAGQMQMPTALAQ